MSTAALLYALLAEALALFHLALAFGAPWGHLTLGGRMPGRLLGRFRALAFVQSLLLDAMAVIMLDAGGVLPLGLPAWAAWAVLGLTAASLLASLFSPSRAERLLWLPVLGVMLVAGLIVQGAG